MMSRTAVPDYILAGFKGFLPETVLGITFCVLLLVSLVARNNRALSVTISLAGIAVSALLVRGAGVPALIFSRMYAVDALSAFFKFVILGSSALTVLFSSQSNELGSGKRVLGEYYALLIAMTLGMVLMASASN